MPSIRVTLQNPRSSEWSFVPPSLGSVRRPFLCLEISCHWDKELVIYFQEEDLGALERLGVVVEESLAALRAQVGAVTPSSCYSGR